MERVCEELDDAKAEIEKLRAKLKTEVEISENLKKARNEQLVQSQEGRSKIERMVQELNVKSEELSMVKKTCEDLECRLNEKVSLARHLSVVNDKLKVDRNEKCGRWEEEKRGLVLAIEEANEKNAHQEEKIQGYVVEIEGLKELLTASQKRSLEAEKNAKASKELRQREDFVLKLEEENQNVKDRLKWKKEQFKHLEEAHEKLKCQFKESKKEWEKEKATLVDEICSLQGRLDSQIRISEDLQNRLKICNQVLAHEESRRKQLEVELSEFRAQFEDVFSECQEAKSQLEYLTNQQGNDIGALRHALGTKEIILKETEYQLRKLEEENKELLESLKEHREAQIQSAGSSSSLGKLRNKLRNLEQMHRDCPSIIKSKEAEWSAQMEKLARELNSYMSTLESKETELKRLEVELENCQSVIMRMKLEKELEGTSVKEHEMQLEHCHSEIMQLKLESGSRETAVKGLRMELENCRSVMVQLELENEEAAVMLLLLKSEITEAKMRLEKTQAEIDLYNKEREEAIYHLVKELEMKNIALSKALKCAKDESEEKAAFFSEKDEALKLLEVENKALSRALEDRKEDYKRTAALLKREERKIQQIREELNKVNTELAEKACETHAAEFELWLWKSITQRLKDELEESHALRKQLEASLLAQVAVGETFKQEKDGFARMLEAKDRRLDILQQQIGLAEQELKARESVFTSAQTETTLSFELEKESFLQAIRDRDQFLEDLNKEIEWLEEESLRKEFEGALLTQMTAERKFKQETANLTQVLENKDQRIDDLLQQVSFLAEKFNSSLMSFSSELFKKQDEISVLHEAWEKIAAAEILALLELEEKKLMILEMEEGISSVQQKLKSQEKALCCSKQQAVEIEAALEAKQSEMLKLSNLMEKKLRTSEAVVNELKSEKRHYIEDVTRLSSEREKLLGLVTTFGDRINQFSDEDLQLMGTLERIVKSFDDNGSCQVQKISNEAFDSRKENMNIHTPPTTKNLQAVVEVRSPFRQVN